MVTGEGRVFELVRCPTGDRGSWLAERRKGVGGSDVAAIMGLSQFRGPYAVWADKTGRSEPEDISDRPAVHWGNVLEPVVCGEYKRMHPDRLVQRLNAVCRSIARPWAQASLDYEVRDPELGWGVLEVKTAGLMRAPDWDEGVPLYYQTQIVHYLSVTGRPFADVAVLIGGQDYREYRVLRDEDDVRAVDEAVDAFWHGFVEEDREPPVTARRDDVDALVGVHPVGDDMEFREVSPEMREFREAKLDRDRAEDRYRAASAAMKQLIGDGKGIETPEGRFTWVRTEGTRLDAKALAAEQPDIYQNYQIGYVRDGGIRFHERKE